MHLVAQPMTRVSIGATQVTSPSASLHILTSLYGWCHKSTQACCCAVRKGREDKVEEEGRGRERREGFTHRPHKANLTQASRARRPRQGSFHADSTVQSPQTGHTPPVSLMRATLRRLKARPTRDLATSMWIQEGGPQRLHHEDTSLYSLSSLLTPLLMTHYATPTRSQWCQRQQAVSPSAGCR